MGGMAGFHPSDTALERYCLGSVKDEGELRALEIHFRKCRWCSYRLAETRWYIDTVRSALRLMSDN